MKFDQNIKVVYVLSLAEVVDVCGVHGVDNIAFEMLSVCLLASPVSGHLLQIS
jgi:hypothetical protein